MNQIGRRMTAAAVEQARDEANYLRLLVEEKLDRAEAAHRRAVGAFLRADERLQEAVALLVQNDPNESVVSLVEAAGHARAAAIEVVAHRRSAVILVQSELESLIPAQGTFSSRPTNR